MKFDPGLIVPDTDRRFGGLARLYGKIGAEHIRAAHIVVVGLGGVGSWAAEAAARSGVARLTLIDFDHIAEIAALVIAGVGTCPQVSGTRNAQMN